MKLKTRLTQTVNKLSVKIICKFKHIPQNLYTFVRGGDELVRIVKLILPCFSVLNRI